MAEKHGLPDDRIAEVLPENAVLMEPWNKGLKMKEKVGRIGHYNWWT